MTGRVKQNPESRFREKFVEDESGCWLWQGALGAGGYGVARWHGKRNGAPRVASELFVGRIPEGLEIDHLCRVRHCVNPAHMEPVTHAENMRRRVPPVRTHCKWGHLYVEENIWWYRGGRVCRTCGRDRQRRFFERKAAAAA
jgi:hypothetical protein